MKLGKKAWLGLVAVVLLAGVAFIVLEYFAPQPTQRVDDTSGAAQLANRQALQSGSFSGADAAHDVSGKVALFETDSGKVLRFSDYEATSGPDVFFYISPTSEFDETKARQLAVPGGLGEGQATLRGNFGVPLPDDASDFSVVIVWCKRFGVKFGEARLQ
jgi:hypothetical protein